MLGYRIHEFKKMLIPPKKPLSGHHHMYFDIKFKRHITKSVMSYFYPYLGTPPFKRV